MTRFASKNWGILLCFGTILLAYAWTPYDPYAQAFVERRGVGFHPQHWLGVDELGQDALSRIWLGAAHTLSYGFAASVLTLVFAGLLLLCEQKGARVVAEFIRSAVSLGIALPVMFLGLLFMMVMEREPRTLLWAIAIATTPFAFRQLRVLWLEQSGATHVEASRAIGGRPWHLFRFSIWPNLKPQLFEIWKIVLAVAILELSALTFLGLAGDPNWAELGSLLHTQQKHLNREPLLVLWPGVVLCGILWQIRLLRWE